MEKNKRVFRLQQHTPLIHFQADQTGATLRSTEVKPKLDVALKAYFKSKRKSYNELLVGYHSKNRKPQHDAFNYRLIIRPRGEKWVESIPAKFPLFFGNMGNTFLEETKKLVFYPEIEFHIHCHFPEIIEAVENILPTFLLTENFGNRQSKGFGSFYLHPNDPLYQAPESTYHFEIKIKNGEDKLDDYEKLFTAIKWLYMAIRGGINLKSREKFEANGFTWQLSTFYCKSLLFTYAKSKGWQWEKKSIKKHFFPNGTPKEITGLEEQIHHYPEADILSFESGEAYLLKDLLGLSSSESWFSYKAKITKTHQKPKDRKSTRIKRFKSPVFFKPILNPEQDRFEVLITTRDIPKPMLGAKFFIRNVRDKSNSDLPLSTPKSFSLDEFFHFIFEAKDQNGQYLVDLRQHIAPQYHDQEEFLILDRIFSQIRTNLIQPAS
ncbi:MAG: hypothetical protein AAF927_03535 [Bacteroidota bacterium]